MKQKAQSIMEYVALLAIVSTALFTMQLYFKQGVQAGIKPFADYIGSQKKGSAEDEYQYKWFTDAVEGLRSRSSVGSEEHRSSRTILGSNPGEVTYIRNDTIEQGKVVEPLDPIIGLAHWSVGIKRERAEGRTQE